MSQDDYHIRLSISSGRLLMISDSSVVPLVDVMVDKVRPVTINRTDFENVKEILKTTEQKEMTKEFMQTLAGMTYMELSRFYCLLQRMSECVINELETRMNPDDIEDPIDIIKLTRNEIYISESDMKL